MNTVQQLRHEITSESLSCIELFPHAVEYNAVRKLFHQGWMDGEFIRVSRSGVALIQPGRMTLAIAWED